MYLLLKHLGNTDAYNVEKRAENIQDISKEIEKRVTDGCAVNKLKVVEEIPFEFKCAVKYGEDLRDKG